jgi:uncharacterized membrane protein
MKASRLLNASLLLLLCGSSIALFAQQPEEKPKDTEPPRQEEARPAQDQAKPEANQDRTNDSMKMKQQQQEDKKQVEKQNDNKMMKSGQAHPAAGSSKHIPDDKFRSHFGRQHTFAINRPVVVGGQTQFVSNGYTFVFVDPWPAGWAYTDDCYVDYIDGEYFLFDLAHPGMRIALLVNF